MRAFAAAVVLVCAVQAQPSEAAGFAGPAEVATLVTSGRATSFVVAKTGRVAGAVCDDGKLLLWTLPDGRVLRKIDLGGRTIDAFVMSEDGGSIAVGDHAGGYTVWDTATGAERMSVNMPFYPAALAFSADGRRLAIAPVGEPVQIHDPGSGRKLLELQRPTGGSEAVVFSRDGRRIATADADTAVRIYDAHTGVMLARNADFLLEPLAADFGADGKLIVAGGGDKVVAFLEITTGSAIRKSAKAADPVAYLEVSPDGALVAALLMHADDLLKPAPVLMLETASGRTVQEWLPAGLVLGGRWTRDGHFLVAIASERALHIWRAR